MSEELKPCPFCDVSPVAGFEAGTFSIRCESAFCSMSSIYGPYHDHDLIVDTWNTRHITAADVPASVKREIQAAALEAVCGYWKSRECVAGALRGAGANNLEAIADCVRRGVIVISDKKVMEQNK